MNTPQISRRMATVFVAGALSLGLTATMAEAAEPTAASTVSFTQASIAVTTAMDAAWWFATYTTFINAGATPAEAVVAADRVSTRPADAQVRIDADTAAYDAKMKATAEAIAAKVKADALAAKARADAAATSRATIPLPQVRVTGGTKSQRARVLRLAKAAGAPRGTVIRIASNPNWGTSFPGSAANGHGTLIRIQPQVVRGGGARLRYVITHEVMHARQFKASRHSWNRMWMNAGAKGYNGSNARVDCQADRMTQLTGVPLVRGSYLSRGYGRYCSVAGAKKVLAASR